MSIDVYGLIFFLFVNPRRDRKRKEKGEKEGMEEESLLSNELKSNDKVREGVVEEKEYILSWFFNFLWSFTGVLLFISPLNFSHSNTKFMLVVPSNTHTHTHIHTHIHTHTHMQSEDPWLVPSSDEITFRSAHTVPVLLTWQNVHVTLPPPTSLFSCLSSEPPGEEKVVLDVSG